MSDVVKMAKALADWKSRCQKARDGHYKRAETLFYRAEILGYLLIYSTVFITVFSLFKLSDTQLIWGITRQHIVVIIGCFSAVVSGIVTQSKYGERAEIHRSSGARYANLARDVELMEMKLNTENFSANKATYIDELARLKNDWNNVSDDSLLTPHDPRKSKFLLHTFFIFLFIFLFFIVVR